ncbi:MAG: glycosyltransferase [Desulfobacteraceae bacterium]|nr:MAG: glycosyltransferase [Desulfobacteraceae bacterium]
MNRANIAIIIIISILSVSMWAFFNRPESEPPWPETIMGFCFSPFQKNQDPMRQTFPSPEQIESDLALLVGKTHAIRTYSQEKTLAEIPKLAKKYGINVAIGAWIGDDLIRNQREVELLLKNSLENSNIVRAFIGNEVILRNELPVSDLIKYINYVRRRLEIPVSTAEPWHIWLKYPELAKNVDFIGVHLLPFWEELPVEKAVDYCFKRLDELKKKYPDKPIVIGEVGWPSQGRTRNQAVATPANEARFLRRFLDQATKEGHIYYVMEAFDQPWKRQDEGGVGAYWGVYNLERQPKFVFTQPIIKIPEWRILAGISIMVAIITMTMIIMTSATLNIRGRSFIAVVAFSLATVAVWATYDYIHQYLTVQTILVGILIVSGMIGVIIVLLTEAHEWAETIWVSERRRAFKPVHMDEDKLPMVSIHLPIYNEPPDMIIETLDALTHLDYPKYEVIIVDNNTKDPAVWQPVEAHCRNLGPQFRFFHVDPLSGFKAGALNFALRNTDKNAAIIAVIDSDYLVSPLWLKDLVPQFNSPSVAIVQAPQDYRDEDANAFKSICHAEYRGFFFIGMVTRNERNAIIQHGTMTLIRRSSLQAAGAWSEWCITEDAELGLRIFEKGYEAVYIPKSYGRGLMPDTFIDYKKQRFRWAYGAVQIMRRHAGQLTGSIKTRLTAGQRYHFWAGWLPWIADSLNLAFNMAAVGWSIGMVIEPESFNAPIIVFSVFPLALFCFKLAKIIYLYRGAHIVVSTGRTIAAAIAGLALSHTIAKAVIAGLFTESIPFFRTPKMADSHVFLKAIASAREETLIMVMLWLVAGSVAFSESTPSPDLTVWILVLLIQSLPYLAALIISLISAFPTLGAKQELVAAAAPLLEK